jgi:hypothetical protein
MAGRPRCANCRKAFTPHPRNRNKREHRQRVCGECGQVVGHRLASRRCRARKRRLSPPATPENSASQKTVGPTVSPLAGELALQIQQICAAFVAVVHGPGHPSRAA